MAGKAKKQEHEAGLAMTNQKSNVVHTQGVDSGNRKLGEATYPQSLSSVMYFLSQGSYGFHNPSNSTTNLGPNVLIREFMGDTSHSNPPRQKQELLLGLQQRSPRCVAGGGR